MQMIMTKDVNSFFSATTCRIRFPDGDVEVVITAPWNNFLQSLLCFAYAGGDDEELVKINLPLKSITFSLELKKSTLVFLFLEDKKKKREDTKNKIKLSSIPPLLIYMKFIRLKN